MGLCFHHYSPGKNSNLNAPVLLRQGTALLSHYGTERDENALQKTLCITLLTFPVLIVYKQLWSSFLWALCTSETGTDGGTPCLNEGLFLTCLRCGSQTQPNKHTFTLSLPPKQLQKWERKYIVKEIRWHHFTEEVYFNTQSVQQQKKKSKHMQTSILPPTQETT